MRLTEKIDLHMHTRVSDGTDDPSEMLSRANPANMDFPPLRAAKARLLRF